MFWDLVLPKDYSATVAIRERRSYKPLLEFSLNAGTTAPLYFATTGGRNSSGDQIRFGSRSKISYVSDPIARGARSIRFGAVQGTTAIHLFEVFSPPEETVPLIWCEIQFHKK